MAFDSRWKIQTLWAVVLVLLVSPVRAEEAQAKPDQKRSEQDEYLQLMQEFADTFEQIERNYVTEVNRKQLMEAALRGMLRELDPYSSYIPSDEYEQFNQHVEQEFGGVGIQVQPDPATGRILVISPLPDTPAYRAGVRAGDVLMEVEGEDTENMPISRAVELMKGPPGDKVVISVRHMGASENVKLTVERAVIQVKSVLGDSYGPDGQWKLMLDEENKIGYIRLSQFGRHSSEELAAALQKLTDAGMKALVLDLRYNPGGLLSQAVSVADLFLESGPIVSTEGKNVEKRTFSATKPGTFNGFPMVVLINRFSASASEIVSAALQDRDRAEIIGERSWGKGSVQNVIELGSGGSAVKLTTAGYVRPNGRNIHRSPKSGPDEEWGVRPKEGFEVRFSREELEKYDQYRRERDVLRENGPVPSDFKDRQLDRALEHLKSVLAAAPKAEETTPKTE